MGIEKTIQWNLDLIKDCHKVLVEYGVRNDTTLRWFRVQRDDCEFVYNEECQDNWIEYLDIGN